MLRAYCLIIDIFIFPGEETVMRAMRIFVAMIGIILIRNVKFKVFISNRILK